MLFGNDPNDRFRPKKISIKEVYQHAAKRHDISDEDHVLARAALKSAGYDNDKIERLLNQHEQIPVTEMREVAQHLQTAGVSGFASQPDSKKLVQSYVRSQMVKKRNIAYVRADHMREAMRENLQPPKGVTPIGKPSGKGPKLSF